MKCSGNRLSRRNALTVGAIGGLGLTLADFFQLRAARGELKKYEDVITARAKTSKGVFTVHRIDDKVYFEIPASAYGKLMLWTSEVAKAPPGVGWGGT